MRKFNRRNFLTTSAAMCGYSLVVSAPKTASANQAKSGAKKHSFSPKDAVGILEDTVELQCDILVAGGGLAGICSAISAARHGKKVVLVQDRSRLGGNSSSEIKMHPLGVFSPNTGWREGGIIEELKLANAATNPQLAWEMWDFLLYDKCVSEKNITLLLDTAVCGVDMGGEKILAAYARCSTSRKLYKISGKFFIVCS